MGFEDWERLGQGTLVGRLLECAGQITGGFFAAPAEDVEGLARLGFPFGEVTLTARPSSAGSPGRAAALHSPRARSSFSTKCTIPRLISNLMWWPTSPPCACGRKARTGSRDGRPGRRRTGKLKVSVGYRDGFVGEGQISYGGPGARERGELAIRIVRERLKLLGLTPDEMRSDLIGITSLSVDRLGDGLEPSTDPLEVRARVAGRVGTRREAQKIGRRSRILRRRAGRRRRRLEGRA